MASFADLIRKLDRLAEPATLTTVSTDMAEESLALVDEGFDHDADPYGEPWDAPNDLEETGEMRSSLAVEHADADGYAVGFADPKARFHQDGTGKMDQRRLVPEGGKLPSAWSKRLKATAARAIRSRIA